MRNLRKMQKRMALGGNVGDDFNGAFSIRVNGENFMAIASNGSGWEHVSVSHKNRIPTWGEMCKIKELFFYDDEVVMQLHPEKKDHINLHENCLHLWRPIKQEIPMPPKWMIG